MEMARRPFPPKISPPKRDKIRVEEVVKLRPLERRTFKVKNPSMSFYCPLCRTPRALTTSFRLSVTNYLQILLLTIITTTVTYPLMSFRGIFSFFIFWAGFEWVRRANYRKEIPCPHCGFDASWYKKDVKVARKLVAEHFSEKSENPSEEAIEVPEELAFAEQDNFDSSPFDQGY